MTTGMGFKTTSSLLVVTHVQTVICIWIAMIEVSMLMTSRTSVEAFLTTKANNPGCDLKFHTLVNFLITNVVSFWTDVQFQDCERTLILE